MSALLGIKYYIFLLGINILCFTSFLLPISFLSDFSENKGISKITIGLILSFYPIGATLASIILAKYMSLLGKLKLI